VRSVLIINRGKLDMTNVVIGKSDDHRNKRLELVLR
jgi:hypothetical protein